MKVKKLFFYIAALAGAGLLCSCSTPSYDIQVYLSPELKKTYQLYPSIEFDVAGMTAADSEAFKEIKVFDYFQPNGLLRKRAMHATLHFSEEDPAPKRLSYRNPIWKAFEDNEVRSLCLIVNLPVAKNSEVKTDFRKCIIPLSSSWFSTNRRFFELTSAGIVQLAVPPKNNLAEPRDDGKFSEVNP